MVESEGDAVWLLTLGLVVVSLLIAGALLVGFWHEAILRRRKADRGEP